MDTQHCSVKNSNAHPFVHQSFVRLLAGTSSRRSSLLAHPGSHHAITTKIISDRAMFLTSRSTTTDSGE